MRNIFFPHYLSGEPKKQLQHVTINIDIMGSRNLMGVSVELCDSKEEKLFICHSMKISSEKFDFCIE